MWINVGQLSEITDVWVYANSDDMVWHVGFVR